MTTDAARCNLCGEPMPAGEQMFKYHGYSGPCPVPPIPKPARPRIVCLCGSTRFWRTFQEWGLKETLAGRIVLSIGAAAGTDEESFGHLNRVEWAAVKGQLDELHLRKIDLADEVLVLNVAGYIGESTAREIAYAEGLGKPIRYLEPVAAAAPTGPERVNETSTAAPPSAGTAGEAR